MVNLDKKDLRIIYCLCQNSRQSLSSIASLVGLSKNSVKYRVDRLIKNEFMDNFSPAINTYLFGFNTFDILIKLNASPNQEKEVINYLSDYPFTTWFASLSGEWDLILELAAKDSIHLGKMLYEICSKIGDKIVNYDVIITFDFLKLTPLPEDFFDPVNLKLKDDPIRTLKPVTLDNIDANILSLLCKNCTIPQYEIAKQVGLSADSVRYRIKNLEKSGVIVKYIPTFFMKNLGYSEYSVILDLKKPNPDLLAKLYSYIVQNKNITYAISDAIKPRISLYVVVKSSSDLDYLLKELRSLFLDVIRSQKFMLVSKHHKFNLFPKGVKNSF
ncbi:Lrp/AsnC family transcriptional regulator [Candidatus Woesearchaeota archaeon]|jgi:DNA-binding Lrp family transcriptional regulator|nr:Lrp/AsnC family transcriptional regulator [Candidatus Woesearchaeota archaeon]